MRVLVLCLLLVGCGEAVGPEVPPVQVSRLHRDTIAVCHAVTSSANGVTSIAIYC